MAPGPPPQPDSVDAPRGRRRRRDPNRFPAFLEFGALVVVLALVATANHVRGPEHPAEAAEPSEVAASTTSTSTSTTTTTSLPPLVAPPPDAPLDLTEFGPMPLLERVPTEDPVVFITIDDGLNPQPGALALLEEEGIPFTSFLTMPFARENTDFWAEHIRVGGTMQAHTTNHSDLTTLGPEARWSEICGTHDGFTELFGRTPTLFRPPYGAVNDSVQATASGCGYDAIVLWGGSGNDGVVLMQSGELQAGDIVLMHWRDDLEENLRVLMDMAEDAGLRFAQLEDYLSPGS